MAGDGRVDVAAVALLDDGMDDIGRRDDLECVIRDLLSVWIR